MKKLTHTWRAVLWSAWARCEAGGDRLLLAWLLLLRRLFLLMRMVLLILTELLFLPPAAPPAPATAVVAASLFCCCTPTPAVRRVVGNPLAPLLASLLLTTLNNKTNIKSIKKGVNINLKSLSFERVLKTHITFSTENVMCRSSRRGPSITSFKFRLWFIYRFRPDF